MTTAAEIERGHAPARRVRRRSRPLARACLFLGTLVTGVVALALAATYLVLASGSIDLKSYAANVEASLASRLGPGWRASVTDAVVELRGWQPAVRATGLELRNPVGATVVRAPYAVVSLDPASLLAGRLAPRDIELRHLHLRGVISQDGSLTFATPSDETPPIAAPAPATTDVPIVAAPSQPDNPRAPSLVSAAASSLVRPLVEASGIIGGLERARVSDARLTLVGADGRERAAFDDVDAVFEKGGGGDRRFVIDLSGSRGTWHVEGKVSGAKGHASSIRASGVPVADIMLLTGLSKVAVGSDIKLDASLEAAFGRDRLTRFQARLAGSPGVVTRPSRRDIGVEGSSAEMLWDEERRTLDLSRLEVRSEGTEVRLGGQLAFQGQDGWHLSLNGRDMLVAGLDAAQPAFRIATGELAARVDDGQLTVETFRLRGDDLDIAASGTFAPASTDRVFESRLDIADSDARRVIRLWPDTLNKELRSYLATRLDSGRLQKLRLSTRLDANDFRAAFNDDPLSDRSTEFDFAVAGAKLSPVDGVPAIANLAIRGQGTGTKVSISTSGGVVALPDGRRLSVSEGSYLHADLDKPGTRAQIAFRVGGGLDAVASFLRSPVFAEAGLPDVDPATLGGAADLRVGLSIDPTKVPSPAKVPLEIRGTLSDVSADKLPGKEKLEGGQFAVQYEAAALTVKGEGRIGGTPATFDLRAPRGSAGELVVSATLDEAARARRSLPAAPMLVGPVSFRVAVPLAAKAVPRVEVDLARAAVEHLVPGWQKPAGRPGRIAFTLADGNGTELRDLVVDSGSVQIKANLLLSAAGALERAEASSLRLSPGDDMRAQLERGPAGYRVSIRGNNADARPLLKWLQTLPPKTGKDSHETEVDAVLAILSGFNDEAMTGVSAKLSARGGELRSLQFGGRFRSATVEASLGKRDAGAPILSVRTADAGATLRFLDFYRRMTGGQLSLEARSADGILQGQIVIEDFGLRNEPALRRIVAQSAQQGTAADERGAAPTSRQDVNQVLFNRLTTGFRKSAARTDYTDAVIYGPQVGFNLSGWVDTVRDRLDVTGTFVPAYLLNNAFSQIPVVGLILGGGRTEGLIAVDFRLAGALSSPQVTVNPLTVVAPGILRKLFGWMMPEGQAEPSGAAAANSAAPQARRRTR